MMGKQQLCLAENPGDKYQGLQTLLKGLINHGYNLQMGADTTQCLSSSNVAQHCSVHANNSFLHVSLCNGSAIALKLQINFSEYYTNPRNDCTFFTIVDTGHSLKLHTFELLMHIPSCIILKPRNVALLHKKLHFLSLQQNVY